MAKKKAPAPKPEKPKLANTKPKIVLKGVGTGNNSKVDAGTEPRQINPGYFDCEEFKALNHDEQRFVQEWLIDRNGTRAYMRAGLQCSSYHSAGMAASQMLKRLSVKSAVEAARKAWAEQTQETLDDIVYNFRQIRDQTMEPIEVFDKLGHPTGFFRFDAANAITANKEVGLALGLLRNKYEVTGKDGKAIEMNVKVEGQIAITLTDLGSLSLPARKEVLAMLEAKENGNGKHE